MRVPTLPEIFQRAVHDHGPRTALRYHRGGDWHPVTYGQLGRLVEEATVGLADHVEPGDRVALASAPGPTRMLASLATAHAGGQLVPLDPSGDVQDLAARLGETEASVCFVEMDALERGLLAEDPIAGEDAILVALPDAPGGEDAQSAVEASSRGLAMRDLYHQGQRVLGSEEARFEKRWRAIDAEHPARLLLPGGEQAPIALAHGHLGADVQALASRWNVEPGDRALVSTSGEGSSSRRGTLRLALLAAGAQLWSPRSLDRVPADVRACRPEMLVADGEALAALERSIEQRLAASQELQRSLYAWATSVGRSHLAACREEGPGLGLRARRWLAEGLVLAKLRAEMGLDAVHTMLSPEIAGEQVDWFHAIGAPLGGLYGRAETGPVAMDLQASPVAGTAGEPLAGVDVRIRGASSDPGGEGEILVRGASVPDALLDEGGWLATGDKGHLDEQGHLHVKRSTGPASVDAERMGHRETP